SGCRQVLSVAILRHFDTPDQFHDEVRPAALRCARVEDMGDVRVIHECQDLSLRFKSGNDTLGVHSRFDHLHCHASAYRFLLLGHENHSTTALADLLEQFVATDPVAGLFSYCKSFVLPLWYSGCGFSQKTPFCSLLEST